MAGISHQNVDMNIKVIFLLQSEIDFLKNNNTLVQNLKGHLIVVSSLLEGRHYVYLVYYFTIN